MEHSGFNREDLFFEFLDLKNVRDRESKRTLLNMIRKKYSRLYIDLIITVHQGALDLLLKEGKDILPEVPVLAWIPTGPSTPPMGFDAKQTGRRVLPVYARLDMKGTLERALDLFPQTRHVLFVSGAWKTERQITQEIKAIFSGFDDNLEFEYTDNLSMEEMLERAAHLPPHAIIIYYIVLRDKTGRNFLAEDVAKKVTKIANAPVFCVYKSLLVDGVVGGSVLGYESEGARIAGIAGTMLAGEIGRAQQAASAAAKPVVMFDWQQIKKWKGDVRHLPEETVFINRPVSLWEQYGWYLAAFIAFSLIQSGLIALLAVQMKRKARAEAAVRRSEEEIRTLNRELEARVADRTARLKAANKELEAFAYSVSHDLRAPLRHIIGFLELLGKCAGIALDAESRHYMNNICDAAKKMGLLIEDLLSFSRMGRNAMSVRQVELEPLVRDVIREFEPDTAERDIDWHIGDLPVVGGDASMLRIVFDNLISNALKFTQPRKMAHIEIGTRPGPDSDAVIYVRDNGVGFDMAYVNNLFGVFQRLHRADEFEGTGIGLANVRRIVARHGGRTWAESVPDQGATFFFALPRELRGDRDERP